MQIGASLVQMSSSRRCLLDLRQNVNKVSHKVQEGLTSFGNNLLAETKLVIESVRQKVLHVQCPQRDTPCS